ncbi:sensor histidine kinase [Brachybacterium tyrofermentans]|uniref:Sensor histidine kinase n=1 Tax=Brachybacterium tyrofermentans TaxID=47848 RepID=A0ABW0FKY1_9MICO
MNTLARPVPTSPDECDERSLPWVARRPGAWYALLWLPLLLLAPVVVSIQTGRIGQLLMLLLLAALHIATVLGRHRSVSREHPALRGILGSEVLVAAATLAVVCYQFLWNEHQVFLYPLLALGMAVGLRHRLVMGFIGGLAVSGAIAAGITTGSLADALVFAVVTYMAGLSAFLIDRLLETTMQLSATREQLARTAVLEERERFSRDLHDLLGHTLSLIVVKAEAVRRFVPTDPDAAAEHARSIEEIGRSALGEVRQAVVGYRETTLADELEAARLALADAGMLIDIEVLTGAVELPGPVDRLFAWVVREGTTNILRHARARSCRILVESGGGEATLEITDDGGAVSAPIRPGSGLAGLRERAEALGGVLVADREAGGFRLGASVPTSEEERA